MSPTRATRTRPFPRSPPSSSARSHRVWLARTHSRFERCWEIGYPVTYDQLRDRRVGLVALACVDLAIWDAIGKALGVPLWQLWGGYRNTIQAIIIGGYYGRDLAGIRDEVAEWRDMGFRGCKFKVGGRTPPRTPSGLRQPARRPGTTSSSRSTPTRGTRLPMALELCERVADLNIRWFEEPCRWANDRRDMREVRARGGIPVCAGQSEHSPEACRDLMETGAIDVCNFDASWSGGYTNWRRMAAAAHLYSVAARSPRGAPGRRPPARQPAARNLRRGIPPRPRSDLVEHPRNPPEVVDGHIALPSRPGFGWVLDGDFIERYRVDRG